MCNVITTLHTEYQINLLKKVFAGIVVHNTRNLCKLYETCTNCTSFIFCTFHTDVHLYRILDIVDEMQWRSQNAEKVTHIKGRLLS